MRCAFFPPGANSGADFALARGVTVAVRRDEGMSTRSLRGNPRPDGATFRRTPRRGARPERLETRAASGAAVSEDMIADTQHSRDGDLLLRMRAR